MTPWKTTKLIRTRRRGRWAERQGERNACAGGDRPSCEPLHARDLRRRREPDKRKLVPALYNLKAHGLLPPEFAVVGVTRKEKSHGQFREEQSRDMREFATAAVDDTVWAGLRSVFYYQAGEFTDPVTYAGLASLLPLPAARRRMVRSASWRSALTSEGAVVTNPLETLAAHLVDPRRGATGPRPSSESFSRAWRRRRSGCPGGPPRGAGGPRGCDRGAKRDGGRATGLPGFAESYRRAGSGFDRWFGLSTSDGRDPGYARAGSTGLPLDRVVATTSGNRSVSSRRS
jgi:Glucose-6-phosphate dehydrogenase, NAD binding domain